MNKQLKSIVLMGVYWGVLYTILMSVLRWIQGEALAFDSLLLLLPISILGGMVVGYFVHRKKSKQDVFR